MRKILIAVLVTVTIFAINDVYAQSFMDKAKAKAKAKAATQSKEKANKATVKGASISSKNGKETYHLLEAERSPAGGTTKTLILEEGVFENTKVLVIVACERGCTPAKYNYQDESSQILGKKIYFTSAGIYVMQYDDNSWVSIMPTKQLGKAPFDKIVFSNFYSTNAAKVKSMTKAKAEAYAIELSKKILVP